MMRTRNIVHSLTVANWNGIDYVKTLNYHAIITHLIGHTGAGKTTLMIAHLTAMMPDKRLLHFKNTTETGHNYLYKADKGLYGRIGANGACYSVIDYRGLKEERILVGVQLRRKTEPDIELIPFHILGIPLDVEVKDLLLVKGLNKSIFFAEKDDIRSNAAIYGGTLGWYSNLSDYMNFLFEKRIIPKRMTRYEDRKQYYRLLETSQYGGISSEIQQKLRDYLLAYDSSVQTSVSSMQNALKESQRTRIKIETTQQHRDFISNTYKNALKMGAATLVSEELKSTAARKTAAEAKNTFNKRDTEFLDLKKACENLSTQEKELREKSHNLTEALNLATEYERKANVADKLQDKITSTQAEIKTTSELLDKEQAQLDKNTLTQASLENKVKQIETSKDELSDQLASAEQAYSIELKHSALYI
jgi:chromosome partition protein MukB